jgi:hypothetical protein
MALNLALDQFIQEKSICRRAKEIKYRKHLMDYTISKPL